MAETETHPLIRASTRSSDGVAPYTKPFHPACVVWRSSSTATSSNWCATAPDWDELGKAVMRTRFPNLDDKTLLEMWSWRCPPRRKDPSR